MKRKVEKTKGKDSFDAHRRTREALDRMAGNATAAAERIINEKRHEAMSAEEKLQERTDDLMWRTP